MLHSPLPIDDAHVKKMVRKEFERLDPWVSPHHLNKQVDEWMEARAGYHFMSRPADVGIATGVWRKDILFIKPCGWSTSSVPVIDALTRKMAAAMNVGLPVRGHMGTHTCSCGISSSIDLVLPDGSLICSLAIHYLAWHRSAMWWRWIQLRRIAALPYGEAPADYTAYQVELKRPSIASIQL